MDEKEARFEAIWRDAPDLERQGRYTEALAMWQEALALKQQFGITGSGDIGELDGIQARINSLKESV